MKNFISKVKDICNAIIAGVAVTGIIALVISWIVTFITGSLGLAIWTTRWFWGLF